MGTRQTTIRFPEITDRQLEDLAALYGDRTKAVVVAIDRLHQAEMRGEQEMDDHRLTTEDRVAQVSYLRDLVADFVFSSDDPSSSAQDRVDYYCQEFANDLPEWFDDHDKALLVRWLAEAESDD